MPLLPGWERGERLRQPARVRILAGLVILASGPGLLHAQDHVLERDVAPFSVSEDGVELPYPFLGGFDAPRPQFADIDDDGDVDLFLQEHPGALMFLQNEGSPSSPAFALITERYQDLDVGQWAVLADLDGDLDLDMIAERAFGLIRVYRNEGSRSSAAFVEAVDTLRSDTGDLITADATIPVLADVDCNGRIDLMLGRDAGTISRFEWIGGDGDGNPIFTFVENRYQDIEVVGGVGKRGSSALHGASSVTFTDLDADGDPDLLWGDFFEPNLILFRNQGSCAAPAFDRETDDAMRSGPDPVDTSGYNAPRVTDIDADGRLDLFVGVLGGAFVTSSSGVDNFYRFEHDGGSFNLVTRRFLPVLDVGSEAAPAVVDLEGGGRPGLVIGNIISPLDPTRASIVVLQNGASGMSVVDVDAVPFRGFSATPAATDLGCDGDPDLFVGSFDGTISSFVAERSAGAVTWTLDQAAYGGIDVGSGSAPAWADIDADGDEDLFVGETAGTINFFRNVGSPCQPVLVLEDEAYAAIDAGRLSRPAFVDYDSDGDLDLFVGSDAAIVRFFRNRGTAEVASYEEGEPVELPYPGIASPAAADFDLDGDPDLVVGVSSGGLLFFRNDRIVTEVESDDVPPSESLRVGTVFPNPATDALVLEVTTQQTGSVVVEAIDVLGRVATRHVVEAVRGGSQRLRIDVRGLTPGAYVLRIRAGSATDAHPFVIVR